MNKVLGHNPYNNLIHKGKNIKESGDHFCKHNKDSPKLHIFDYYKPSHKYLNEEHQTLYLIRNVGKNMC